jgi:hypothetical protein
MRPGDVIADRFVVEALVGAGGMGSVLVRALAERPAAATTLRETLASARRLDVAGVAGALLNLGWALGRAGELDGEAAGYLGRTR